jgi:hypothetical protein
LRVGDKLSSTPRLFARPSSTATVNKNTGQEENFDKVFFFLATDDTPFSRSNVCLLSLVVVYLNMNQYLIYIYKYHLIRKRKNHFFFLGWDTLCSNIAGRPTKKKKEIGWRSYHLSAPPIKQFFFFFKFVCVFAAKKNKNKILSRRRKNRRTDVRHHRQTDTHTHKRKRKRNKTRQHTKNKKKETRRQLE